MYFGWECFWPISPMATAEYITVAEHSSTDSLSACICKFFGIRDVHGHEIVVFVGCTNLKKTYFQPKQLEWFLHTNNYELQSKIIFVAEDIGSRAIYTDYLLTQPMQL